MNMRDPQCKLALEQCFDANAAKCSEDKGFRQKLCENEFSQLLITTSIQGMLFTVSTESTALAFLRYLAN
jgi:hypothetical protein